MTLSLLELLIAAKNTNSVVGLNNIWCFWLQYIDKINSKQKNLIIIENFILNEYQVKHWNGLLITFVNLSASPIINIKFHVFILVLNYIIEIDQYLHSKSLHPIRQISREGWFSIKG